jgi:hypothetical protein
MRPNALLIDPRDDVVTVLQAVAPGEPVRWTGGETIVAREEIPIAHKVAIRPISAGEMVRKYGSAIGTAGVAIVPGDRVHTHNLGSVGA